MMASPAANASLNLNRIVPPAWVQVRKTDGGHRRLVSDQPYVHGVSARAARGVAGTDFSSRQAKNRTGRSTTKPPGWREQLPRAATVVRDVKCCRGTARLAATGRTVVRRYSLRVRTSSVRPH